MALVIMSLHSAKNKKDQVPLGKFITEVRAFSRTRHGNIAIALPVPPSRGKAMKEPTPAA